MVATSPPRPEVVPPQWGVLFCLASETRFHVTYVIPLVLGCRAPRGPVLALWCSTLHTLWIIVTLGHFGSSLLPFA